jgi:hypothetical protein
MGHHALAAVKGEQAKPKTPSLLADFLGVEACKGFGGDFFGDTPDNRCLADAGRAGQQQNLRPTICRQGRPR